MQQRANAEELDARTGSATLQHEARADGSEGLTRPLHAPRRALACMPRTAERHPFCPRSLLRHHSASPSFRRRRRSATVVEVGPKRALVSAKAASAAERHAQQERDWSEAPNTEMLLSVPYRSLRMRVRGCRCECTHHASDAHAYACANRKASRVNGSPWLAPCDVSPMLLSHRQAAGMLKERSRKFKEQVLVLGSAPNRSISQISANEPSEAQLKHRCWIRRQRSWISPRRRKRHSRTYDGRMRPVRARAKSIVSPANMHRDSQRL